MSGKTEAFGNGSCHVGSIDMSLSENLRPRDHRCAAIISCPLYGFVHFFLNLKMWCALWPYFFGDDPLDIIGIGGIPFSDYAMCSSVASKFAQSPGQVENVLSAALAAVADGDLYLPVQIHKINPKPQSYLEV